MKQFENGVHLISNHEYHSSAGVSRSALWKLRKSPYHYWHEYINPDFVKPDPTEAMHFGSLVHTMVLEPEKLAEEYIVKPELTPLPPALKLKDVGKEAFEANKSERESIRVANDMVMEQFNKESDGKIVVSVDDYKKAQDMAQSVMNHETAKGLINGAKVEHSIYFTHQPTGLQAKVRPDAWLGSIVTDLKTTRDASFRAFQSEAYRSGYFLQAGMIYEALKSIDVKMEQFVFSCIEKSEPYLNAIYILDDAAVDYGINLFDKLMAKLKSCLDADEWPDYGIETLTVPNYANYED